MKFLAVLSSYSRLAAFAAAAVVTGLFASVPGFAQVEDFAVQGGRTLSIMSTTGQAGSTVDISVELDSQGDETAASFSLGWDPAVFSNPVVTLGSEAPAGAAVSVNSSQAAQGRLGILVDATLPFGLSGGDGDTRQVVNVRLNIAGGAQGAATINFITTPTPLSVSNAQGALLTTVYQVGTVNIMPSNSEPITISGRVTSPTGQNLRNITVSLIDSVTGVRRTAVTSSFGIYTFANVPSNREYTVTPTSKRYRFAPRIFTPSDSLANVDFIGLE